MSRIEHKFCLYCMASVEEGKPCGNCGLTQGSYTPSPHHLPPGTVLKDRYLVGRVLGEGGFGITYIGCDLQLELKVAIKEYFPTDKASRVSQASLEVSSYTGAAGVNYGKGLKKFLQEARTIARMDKQPVIVNVRDFFEINHTAYIVMEYVDGTTFKELVEQRGGRIPAGELLYLMEPLFFALKEMHGNGLIHRDISPENLMIEKGEIRLLDFGCARESADGGNTLTIALKHGYAPVEQYQSKGQGPWTDVYALSATIYYCLTGRKPPQAMDRLLEDELIPPRQLGVDLTQLQEQALLRGLSVAPRRRFQSMDEFHTALYEGFIPGAAEEEEPRQEPDVTVPAEAIESADVEKVEENEVITDTAEEKTGSSFDLTAWLKQNKLLAGGIAAALALVILLAAVLPRVTGKPDTDKTGPVPPVTDSTDIPGNTGSTEPPAEPEGPKAITDEESSALFANAVHLEEADEDQFRALLADPAVESVYLENGVYINLNDGELTINKPVRIGRSGGLGFVWPVTVGEGGHLRVMGNAEVVGLLRTVDGGSVLVGEGGCIEDSGMVWLERETDLVLDGGTRDIPEERVLVFCEEETFANATHVTNYAEYEHARNNAEAVVIDADISLKGWGNKNHIVPVLISEGVTVTAPVVDDPVTGEAVSYDAWDIDGTVLVNRGTLRGRSVLGAWGNRNQTPVLLNYGTFHADVYNDTETCQGRGIVVNLGTMSIPRGYLHQMFFANLGTFLHGYLAPEGEEAVDFSEIFEHHYYLNFRDSGVYNSGVIRLQGAEADFQNRIMCALNLELRSQINNVGSIEIGEHTDLTNDSWLRNHGEIHVTGGGALNNAGLIDNCSPRSVLDAGNGCYSVGIIMAGPLAGVTLPEDAFNEGGAMMNFSWGSGEHANTAYVTDAKGLLEALADNSVETVVVHAPLSEVSSERLVVNITLDEPLVVTKGLAVAGDCSLTVPGLTVKGKDAFLKADCPINLMGKELQVKDGVVAVMPAPEDCGGIDVTNQANLMLTGGPDLNPWTEISVSEVGYLTSLWGMSLQQNHVTLNDGIFRFCGGMEMIGCTVDAGQNSNFGGLLINGGDALIDKDTTINIYGRGDMSAGGDNVELYGKIVNNGRLELRDNFTITGRVVNHGTLHIGGGPGLRVPVKGTLENDGTVEFDPGVKLEVWSLTGSVSGVPLDYIQ